MLRSSSLKAIEELERLQAARLSLDAAHSRLIRQILTESTSVLQWERSFLCQRWHSNGAVNRPIV